MSAGDPAGVDLTPEAVRARRRAALAVQKVRNSYRADIDRANRAIDANTNPDMVASLKRAQGVLVAVHRELGTAVDLIATDADLDEGAGQ